MRTHSSLPHSAQHSASYTTAQLATMPTGLSACHSSETDTDLCVGSEHCVTSSVCYFKCALWKCIHMRNPICLRSYDCTKENSTVDESDLLKVMWERLLTLLVFATWDKNLCTGTLTYHQSISGLSTKLFLTNLITLVKIMQTSYRK